MDERADLLMTLLDERYGLSLEECTARDTVSDHVDQVAELMRIGRQAAKVYVTAEVISDMADRIAAAVREHQAEREPPTLRVVE